MQFFKTDCNQFTFQPGSIVLAIFYSLKMIIFCNLLQYLHNFCTNCNTCNREEIKIGVISMHQFLLVFETFLHWLKVLESFHAASYNQNVNTAYITVSA